MMTRAPLASEDNQIPLEARLELFLEQLRQTTKGLEELLAQVREEKR
jgi:hypothetical protein